MSAPKRQPNGDITSHAAKTLLHSGALLVAYLLAHLTATPFRDTFMVEDEIATLIFLPFGIKILSAYFEGWSSILYLAPGALIASVLYRPVIYSDMDSLLVLLIRYGTAPALFTAIDWIGRCDRRKVAPPLGWRCLVVGGLLTALTISTLTHLILTHVPAFSPAFIVNLTKAIMSNLVGFCATLIILNFSLYRSWRKT